MYGLYIHIPFCQKICYYCDFFVDKNISLIQRYVDALCDEIQNEMSVYNHKPNISTIYFGGGTPSLLSANQLEQIINKLKLFFQIDTVDEFSLESNPGSINFETLNAYRSLGVNRLSIGVQSFNKRELGFLKRSHSPKKAIKSIEDARKAGFDNINIDLIFSLPNQTREIFRNSLDIAFDLGTTHLSAYSLIYEEGTPLYEAWKKGKVSKINDDEDAETYEMIINEALKIGLKQYEVSNFAFDSYMCQHNLASWQCKEYFAFGVSAHGYLDNYRFWKIKNLNDYFSLTKNNKSSIIGRELISEKDKLNELIFLGLRSIGIDILKIKNTYNIDISKVLTKKLEYYIDTNYIFIENNLIKLTSKGYAICDTITFSFIELIEIYLQMNKNSLILHNT